MLTLMRKSSVRNALAVVLAVVCALMSVQRAEAIKNEVGHSVLAEHSGQDGYGGGSRYAALDARFADHAHADAASQPDLDAPPIPHHHHNTDGPQFANPASGASPAVLLSSTPAEFVHMTAGGPRTRVVGLERPPRPRDLRRT